jgi:hypothetical protein
MSEQDLKHMWKRQDVAAATFTPAELRDKADVFRRTIRRRNLLEYAAGAIAIAGSCFNIWLFGDALTRVASLVSIVGIGIVLWQLHRRASTHAAPEDLGQPGLRSYRAQLVRQRDAMRSVWLWYILPLLPGYELFIWSRRVAMAMSGGGWWIYALMPALGAVVVALNLYGARKLKREIDHLDRETDGVVE